MNEPLKNTDFNQERLDSAKQAIAERFDFKSWTDLEEVSRPKEMAHYWEQVSILLSYQLEDHAMVLRRWSAVSDYVQQNSKGLRIGSSIADHVLNLVKQIPI